MKLVNLRSKYSHEALSELSKLSEIIIQSWTDASLGGLKNYAHFYSVLVLRKSSSSLAERCKIIIFILSPSQVTFEALGTKRTNEAIKLNLIK